MSKPVRFISLNVENSKHIEGVRRFLIEQKPDIICLQELLESELAFLRSELNMDGLFCPMTLRRRDDTGKLEKEGTAILSRITLSNTEVSYYRGGSELKLFNKESPEKLFETVYAGIAKAKMQADGQDYTVVTTHFTWSPNGEATDRQRQDIENLLQLLKQYDSFILCGDFNAPRGGEIFAKIASLYHDNIPLKYKTSLDQKLHRMPGLMLMVDGLFSTDDYIVEEVNLLDGVSDHCAVSATISKKPSQTDGSSPTIVL